MDPKRFTRVLGRSFGRAAKAVLRVYPRGGPVRFETLLAVRSALPGRDPLATTFRHARAPGSDINDPFLSAAFASTELGTWAIGPATIDLLEREIARLRPGRVLELGSGVSTVCLSHFMKKLHGGGEGPLVTSVEQSEEQASRTRSMLAQHDLAHMAEVLVRGLVVQHVEGRPIRCYDLTTLLIPRPVDLLFIDGPSGEPGIRLGTLPLSLRYCAPGARFLMDDALRDGELEIARAWNRLAGVSVEGVFLSETGVLVGRVG